MPDNSNLRGPYTLLIYTRCPPSKPVHMPRAPTFREIEVFRAVMLSGTTTAAAVMLHTTQPSVSRVLAQMQTGTDLKLFDMEKGRLRPTPEAQRLFETVQGHFQGLARIGQEVHLLRRSGTGLLRLGCTPTLGLGPMPGIVARFIERAYRQAGALRQGGLDVEVAPGHLLADLIDDAPCARHVRPC